MKIRKNDKVQIMSGKDSGKQGKVLKVDPKKGKVLIEGLSERAGKGKKAKSLRFPAP
jgi:large subunit ribosomal protein L24